MENINRNLSQIFANLAVEYEKLGETYRARAYRNAALNIANYSIPITSGKQAQKAKIGVGKSIADKIDEYIKTGTLSIFQELGLEKAEKSAEEKAKEGVFEIFEGIYGVGPATATKWYNLGYRTIEDLVNVPKTHAQQLGYYYYYQFKERIPRSEMDEFAVRINSVFTSISVCSDDMWRQQFINRFDLDLLNLKPIGISIDQYYLWLNYWLLNGTIEYVRQQGRQDLDLLWSKNIKSDDSEFLNNCNKVLNVEYIICGSYRRGLLNSGDIDVLIKGQPGLDLSRLVNALTNNGLLIGTLSEGKTKYLGIGRLDDQHIARRIDLMIVQSESWAYATLYFTGSQKLNILMRNRAIELGLTLNEYGLYDLSGNSYPANTEQDIFNYLQLQYLEPNQRNIE